MFDIKIIDIVKIRHGFSDYRSKRTFILDLLIDLEIKNTNQP